MTPRALRPTFIRSFTEAATLRPFMQGLLALQRARVGHEAPPLRTPAREPLAMPAAA